jgi:predicted dehydrogenase
MRKGENSMSNQSTEISNRLSRRTFIMSSAATLAGIAATSSNASASGLWRKGAPDKLRIVVVGAGGRGADNIRDLEACGVEFVALCDADARRAAESFNRHPKAKRYSDWRKMFDAERDYDAVLCATPDHNHAIVSVRAMNLKKHVYCEKPLARSIWEAREMARAASSNRVVTQMGTQGHAFEGTRRAVEVMRSGALGDIKELHVWTDRPAGWWPQGVTRPKEAMPVPDGLDWDVWLGPAALRPYHEAYVPFKWRGFWDFGTGAIGDMGIHNLDTAYWGLSLGDVISAEVKDCSPAFTDPAMKETAPLWSVIEILFDRGAGKSSLKMTWYDGGKLPPMDLFQGEPLVSKDGGSLVIGTKGTLFTRTWHGGLDEKDMFVMLPRKEWMDFKQPPQAYPRVRSHHQEWVDACRGEGKARSNFAYASQLTESLLVGNLALRTGKKIEWDPRTKSAKGCPEADTFIKPEFRAGWTF